MNYIEIYKELAEIHNEIEASILKKIQIGLKVSELCFFIENEISNRNSLGISIAFPVGININNCVAHYSILDLSETREFQDDDVVKIDFGIHKEGYILDAAFTVCFKEDYRDLLENSRKACMEGARMIRVGMNISNISKKIVSSIDTKKYSIIRELCGHQIKPYKIHSGKIIPNIVLDDYNKTILNNEIYTVEPYVSTSKKGDIYYDKRECSHYMFNYHEKDMEKFSNLLKLITDLFSYKTLAFNKRWLCDNSKKYLETLVQKDIYKEYPAIYDKEPKAKIAQFETTILVISDCPIILKNYTNVDKYIIKNVI